MRFARWLRMPESISLSASTAEGPLSYAEARPQSSGKRQVRESSLQAPRSPLPCPALVLLEQTGQIFVQSAMCSEAIPSHGLRKYSYSHRMSTKIVTLTPEFWRLILFTTRESKALRVCKLQHNRARRRTFNVRDCNGETMLGE